MMETLEHDDSVRTLGGPAGFEEEIKKSRFLAFAVRVADPEAALEKVAEIARSDATHNCWAYRIGDEYRFSDDGEPGGSAGRPILAAIDGHGLDQVLVVVTRYFGGTKLGVGGLVRAYGGTASKCLDKANLLVLTPRCLATVEIPFSDISSVHNILPDFRVLKKDEGYTESGVVLSLELEESCWDSFRQELRNTTRGSARFIKVEEIK